MISKETIQKIINIVFLNPQEVLGGSEEGRMLDSVHLISIQLASQTPLQGRGCLLDPILIKMGFSDIDDDIAALNKEEVRYIIKQLKLFDSIIQSWTLIHDIRATEKRPQWRIASEFSPLSIEDGNIEETENGEKILCFDVKGTGLFIGSPKNKSEN